MAKFGMKQLRRYGMGVKQGVHGASKFGVKLSHEVAGLAPLAGLALGPEAGIVLAEGAGLGGMAASALERVSR
jgi:hypothetical protein